MSYPQLTATFAGHFQCKMTDETPKCLTKKPSFVRQSDHQGAKSFREPWHNFKYHIQKQNCKFSKNPPGILQWDIISYMIFCPVLRPISLTIFSYFITSIKWSGEPLTNLEQMLNLVCICLKVESDWIKHGLCLEMGNVTPTGQGNTCKCFICSCPKFLFIEILKPIPVAQSGLIEVNQRLFIINQC